MLDTRCIKARKDTINPLTLRVYDMLRQQLGQSK